MSREVVGCSVVGEGAFGLAERLGEMGLEQGDAWGEVEEERG